MMTKYTYDFEFHYWQRSFSGDRKFSEYIKKLYWKQDFCDKNDSPICWTYHSHCHEVERCILIENIVQLLSQYQLNHLHWKLHIHLLTGSPLMTPCWNCYDAWQKPKLDKVMWCWILESQNGGFKDYCHLQCDAL